MRLLLAGLALALLSISSATHAAGPTRERLKELGSLQRCEQTSPGHVVYQGDSAGLGACLDKLGIAEISELRVTSPGGEAWGTLDIAQRALTRAKLIEQMRAQPRGRSEAEITAMADAALKAVRDEVIAKIPVQQAWAAGVLACDDWLDPHRQLDEPLPTGTAWLLVTPEMARRCLKSAQIGEFWAPPPASELPRGAGFLRARH